MRSFEKSTARIFQDFSKTSERFCMKLPGAREGNHNADRSGSGPKHLFLSGGAPEVWKIHGEGR